MFLVLSIKPHLLSIIPTMFSNLKVRKKITSGIPFNLLVVNHYPHLTHFRLLAIEQEIKLV